MVGGYWGVGCKMLARSEEGDVEYRPGVGIKSAEPSSVLSLYPETRNSRRLSP